MTAPQEPRRLAAEATRCCAVCAAPAAKDSIVCDGCAAKQRDAHALALLRLCACCFNTVSAPRTLCDSCRREVDSGSLERNR